ncbi:multi-sensor signal transduction multi-kinase [Crinalium epipsammum PCC 9333]|uniref:histidine kinase n=1 Tax=Crinalium epipsammum PCC 9333 TaxID=1173022 RepID=K9VY61_9CYAN|nr:ATP-binding sensor histidine kinase [Crinalium epipsammum]AFZ12489.1 multi-sensor signal transduction multi-kinase [Crinalium epipsammum PCC 9333]
MIAISGYKIIEKIYDGVETGVYRAQPDLEENTVIIKILKAKYPTLKEITQLRHEYDISKNLDFAGIIKTYKLENYQNGLFLVLEDLGGLDLKKFLDTHKIDLKDFCEIALQLTDALTVLYEHHIIHKDIKPHNIIIQPITKQVKITDFSIASRLSRENPTINNPNGMEGTLTYISPEQTGRMNRSIDYRTDFYSLGVTFYEMLTGEVPFKSSEPIELVHAHIAKKPIPPIELNPEIPQVISDIVMKLLAKTAEDRYQSALGIKADLEICLNELQNTGSISNFTPGQEDLFAQFVIPQKLYGRETEVATLMAAFERASQGSAEMMLVSGYSGIGKSSLVNEVHKPIVRDRGYFISGKFDQFKRNIPYASVIEAFQDLIRQLLTETSAKIANWKEKLLNALGENGQVITEVLPDVELIIGEQPDVPKLGATESQNRFNRVFQNFSHVFSTKEHPLVLFLDDLQWADSASLKLIQLLITDPDSQYLLFIGAYRDNEVSPTHPLILTLEEIQKLGSTINNIVLTPLDISHVRELVADTLHDQINRSQPLANLVFNKTQGNPFFLTQLLQSLYEEKLLTFDFNVGNWQWNIEQIQGIGITDYSVVQLLAKNIQKLPKSTQRVLKLAACIGNTFNLDVLAIINEKSQPETAEDLWSSLQAGLILPLNEAYKIPLSFDENKSGALILQDFKVSYKFLHDRVQQAAYSLIPEAEKKETHLKIGQLLLEKTNPEERKENIFALVNQLNFGTELITSDAEKYELVELNLIAGIRAKLSNAYEAARKYLNVALALIPENSWQNQYELALALYVEAVEVEYLNIDFEQAEKLSEIVITQAKDLLDKIQVYEYKILFYLAQSQPNVAIELSLQVLEMLNITLAETPPEKLNIEDLVKLPEMQDPHKLAAMRILMVLMPAAAFVNPALLPASAFTMVNLSSQHGNSALAAYSYATYALLLCQFLGDIEAGYKFSQLSLKILEDFNGKKIKAKIFNIVNGFVIHWKAHARETVEPLREGVQVGIETGDIEYACYNAATYSAYIFYIGEPLNFVNQQQSIYVDMMLKLQQKTQVEYAQIFRQLVFCLSKEVTNKYSLCGDFFNTAEMLPIFIGNKNFLLVFVTYLANTLISYWFKNYEQAVTNAMQATQYAFAASGFIHITEHNFYYSLALLGAYPDVENSLQQQYMQQVENNQQAMQLWAENAPANYQHKYDLINAEKARILGNIGEAMEYYDRAIKAAKKQQYTQEEGLANELAAEFYFSRGKDKVATTYLTDAYYCYIHWEATAKVKDLELRYPQIFSQILARKNFSIDLDKTTSLTTAVGTFALDLTTVMKASQTLSREILLNDLIEKLMKIVMENAGAQNSCLILDKKGKLVVEATVFVDKNDLVLFPSIPLEDSETLPLSLINYVARTQENVVLRDAGREGNFITDAYIVKAKLKSILCVPIINQGTVIGILYLENNLTAGAFTPERLEVLRILSTQAAISLKNAMLYANLETATEELKVANTKLEEYSRTLEQKVETRTLELKDKNLRLEQTLTELQQTQTQLIQTEKMSSLGQLVAGIAHEINNPVNFIHGNILHASEYIDGLLNLVNLYQEQYPNSTPKIQDEIEAIDLEFLREDLPKVIESMQIGSERIRQIVLSLRNFSRLDEAEMKKVDIHEGIDSTLLILQHRLKAKSEHSEIKIIKEYGDLPKVECYPGQLNQVFMNIVSNAIDVLEEYDSKRSGLERQQNPCTIRIHTHLIDGNKVKISIADNGSGMREEVRSKIFDPFFTTKSVGSGTGLGLSISYQIVVEKHRGHLECISSPGKGAEFIITIPTS